MYGLPPDPVDAVTGIIRFVLDLPMDPGEPTIFNSSVQLADTRVLGAGSCYDENGGAGVTREAAQQAAIGEGLERYCAAFCDAGDVSVATWSSLARTGPPPPRPGDFALFHPDQQMDVPTFDEDSVVAWRKAYSLTRRCGTFLPACMIHMPYIPTQPDREQIIAPAISTGLACNTRLDAAMASGLYEAIERDAFIIAWLRRLPLDRVDLESDAVVGEFWSSRLRRPGLDYHVLDTTTDVGVPSFFCLLVDERENPPMVCAGGASHHDPTRAVMKSLVEAVQTREWAKYLRRARRTTRTTDYSARASVLHGPVTSFEDHVRRYALGLGGRSLDSFLGRPVAPLQTSSELPGDARIAVRDMVDRLAALGLEVLAVDLTTPDAEVCGYRVVKMLVPGLQPLFADERHPMLGGHRVYRERPDAPCPRPRGPADLNPDPHPYP